MLDFISSALRRNLRCVPPRLLRSVGPLYALAIAAVLAACGNGGASEPPVTSFDPAATSKLQFAIGVATIAFNGGASVAYGLNEVETLRQKDGLSGTEYNIPMIIGPSSFSVLISTETGNEVQYAGSDLGTNHITWGTLNQSQWIGPPRGPKQSTTGAFGYGLCPCNSDSGPGNGFTPLFQAYYLPIYGSTEARWYGGPPAFPAEGPSLTALGWEGYSLGFTDFAVAPVLGKYSFYAAVPPSYDTPQNPTPSPGPNGTPTPPPGILAAGAQLTKLSGLPKFSTPGFKPDRKGGGTINVDVPTGASEAMVVVRAVGGSGIGLCVQSHESDTFYTVVTHKSGAQGLFLADDLGPLTQSGKKTRTICPKGSYQIYAAGVDYPAYEASYPNNLSQFPSITGPNGQADVTTSDLLSGSYP
ncbi:MAG: hypothetical protein JO113_07210 [Candidatus Eremiobacteraeota bacterium]|nr:hypothetical protein [Candidatus Eremiobacteraeota bacterium]